MASLDEQAAASIAFIRHTMARLNGTTPTPPEPTRSKVERPERPLPPAAPVHSALPGIVPLRAVQGRR